MATLDLLKRTLRKDVESAGSSKQPLSESHYSAGFDIIAQGSKSIVYQNFIIPQLSRLLAPFLEAKTRISVLEVGPGPESVLGSLPSYVRRNVKTYSAVEPNNLFHERLNRWFCLPLHDQSPLPCLEQSPNLRPMPFSKCHDTQTSASMDRSGDAHRFHVILFCHSLYGMENKRAVIERAVTMLVEQPQEAMVIVFHRDGTLRLDGMACYRTASFPNGVVRIADDDETLDRFASFVAGCVVHEVDHSEAVQAQWRRTCRTLGRRDERHTGYLVFSAPETMVAFTRNSLMLSELTAHVPQGTGDHTKNRQARSHSAACIVRPTEIGQVQHCVRWALKHKLGLTVVGGSHSDHCLWPNVVAVDMSAFNQVHVVDGEEQGGLSAALVVAEGGCRSVEIIRKALVRGLTVPLGARPSVGAGLWLQGGIGHLSRLHGLACDAIVGAVIVGLVSGEILYVGNVPSHHRPTSAVRPENEEDLLWAVKGAGSNFGIVISVAFKAFTAPVYRTRNWILPLSSSSDSRHQLAVFNHSIARKLPPNCSADAYLYWDADQLHLGVTMFEASSSVGLPPDVAAACQVLGPETSSRTVDCLELFEADMYISGMHDGHSGGKTSSFKRCLFLKNIGAPRVANVMTQAIQNRPSPLCYIHLLHGGGAIVDVAEVATAFGCRDWGFACVITGVWPRDQDGSEISRTVVRWVYGVAQDLLPLSSGAYGADLGPDPRDAVLATKAFGPNQPRLARLKQVWDPANVLGYTCPLSGAQKHKLIILVTGKSCAGKDYCAGIWASSFAMSTRVASISSAIKLEYAAATGADGKRLLRDRAYKEQHRGALTAYFKKRVQQRPELPEEQFLNVVKDSGDVDVLFITGMRDEAPVSVFSHLVPESKLLEVRVKVSKETRQARQGEAIAADGDDDGNVDFCGPDLTFYNDVSGEEAAKEFAEEHLMRWVHPDLQRLASMVSSVSDFPRPGVEFRHVLGISQHPGGLSLCTSLLRSQFPCDWEKVSAVACCEVGGLIYASPLAASFGLPLALIRKAGKLPGPTMSVSKSPSHISNSVAEETEIEIGRDAVSSGASVVVVDDVLATGRTLCAVLQLLDKVGIGAEDVNVLVVAEFPIHRGRELLRCRGFGRAKIHSLLVFGEA